jgi:hypothetical protein
MTDAMNLHNFPPRDDAADLAPVGHAKRPSLVPRHEPIGHIIEVGGSGAAVEIVGRRLSELAGDKDLSIAMSGQVGSQIKIGAGNRWLLANVRKLRSPTPKRAMSPRRSTSSAKATRIARPAG